MALGFLVLTLLGAVITVVLTGSEAVVELVVGECKLVETLTAGTFLAVFALALLHARSVSRHAAGYYALAAAGLLGFLDEVSFGMRLFNFRPPQVAGVHLDAVHDVAELVYRLTLGGTDRGRLLLIAGCAAALLLLGMFVLRPRVSGLASGFVSGFVSGLLGFPGNGYLVWLVGFGLASVVIDFGIISATVGPVAAGVEEVFELSVALSLLAAWVAVRAAQEDRTSQAISWISGLSDRSRVLLRHVRAVTQQKAGGGAPGGWLSRTATAIAQSRPCRLAIYLVVLTVLSARSMYHEPNKRPLRADETIFAGVADQMKVTGDWLYPRRGDGTPYLNKPPLYCWLTALTYDAWGAGPARYRFWSATFGVGCVLLTVALGSRLFNPETGLLAGALLLDNNIFLNDHGARMGCFDTALTFFTLLCFLLYWSEGRLRGRWAAWPLIGAAAAGLSLLKPLAGLPLLALLGGYHLLFDRTRPLAGRVGGVAVAVACSIAIAAPWYLMQVHHYGSAYVDAIFWQNYVQRATEGLDPNHLHGPTFYLTSISTSSNPFALFLPAWACAAALGLRGLLDLRGLRDRCGEAEGRWLFAAFLTAAWVGMFSLSQSKLHWYVFPVYPLIALLIAAPLIGGLERLVVMPRPDEHSDEHPAEHPAEPTPRDAAGTGRHSQDGVRRGVRRAA